MAWLASCHCCCSAARADYAALCSTCDSALVLKHLPRRQVRPLLVDVPASSNITADVMRELAIPRGVRRVLFRTGNTAKCARLPEPC